MNLAIAQAAQQHSALGSLLLLIGVAALLFVFRRSVVLRIRQRRSGAMPPMRGGKSTAQLISEIDAGWWVRRYRGAMKFQRGAGSITGEQAVFLAGITARQAGRRQEWHDGSN